MLYFLPPIIKGLLSISFYTLNTIVWVLPILVFSLIKALIPIKVIRQFLSYALDTMATNWITVNSGIQRLLTRTKISAKGASSLSLKNWYLVLCNHQSWVDILILQRVLNGKIPFLKFFLKKELIWVPFLGLAWWALDFPFMRRYKKSYLAKNPHMRGKDIEATQKACEKFKYKPVSVMNFVEGTRLTDSKHKNQQSPFNHLLKPKAGGVGFVLNAMGKYLTHIVDVTIHYPEGRPTFWQFVQGKVNQVNVNINVIPIDEKLVGNYNEDKKFRVSFQAWLNDLWQQKDAKLSEFNQQTK